MLGFGWLTLRQAQDALKAGRLEEAHRLLQQPDARGHKGSSEMLRQVAQALVERGQRHLQREDHVAAWNDLLQAEQIGAADKASADLRQGLVRAGLAEARAMLDAGEPTRAADTLKQLADRGVQQPQLQLLQGFARGWVQAREFAGRGEFAQALQTLERVAPLLGEPPAALAQFRAELQQAGQRFAPLLLQLHEAADRKHWREVLLLAEQVLALAPQHAEARKARALAWKSVEPATLTVPQRAEGPPPPPPPEPARRYALWIDGVGGFLLCLGNRVTLGQATPETSVDVPLFADVSRLHAALVRDAEGYLLEALRSVQVNGQAVDKVLLQPGDRVTLGTACQFRFSQPVPVSATAQLEMVSGHRLPLALDKVFLMADTLVLGPGPQAHVTVPELRQPVVLFRQKDGLGVRHGGAFQVDAESCRERGMLGPASRVTGEDFAFAVEALGSRLGRT